MATRTETIRYDDLDGETDDVETIHLGYAGKLFEIDLRKANRDALAAALAPYVDAARPLGQLPRRAPASPRPRAAGNSTVDPTVDPAAVRAWAREQGETLPDRGRLPTRVLNAWRDAQAPATS